MFRPFLRKLEFIAVLGAFIYLAACGSNQKATTTAFNDTEAVVNELSIVFYNVENLFDTIDNPITLDEEYTPNSEKAWDTKRYQIKLQHLSKVILEANGGNAPDFIGLSEIENEAVVKDLLAQDGLSKKQYGIVHFESPDLRGIDNAFAYNKEVFKLTQTDKIRIDFTGVIEDKYTSRDIVYCTGKIGNETIHFYVNHWPSRRGGLEASSPKREHVAKQLKSHINNLEANANIIIMGDFNDEPDNISVNKVLGATTIASEPGLYNLMSKLDAQGKGTYNYRGNWNMLDQFIVSTNMLDDDELTILTESVSAFQQTWMMYNDKKYGPTPSRTYGGPNYYGGYSDHLPIAIKLLHTK